MPDKLPDSEIVKALEDEIHLAEYVDSGFCNGVNLSLVKSTLDLINRLQAENEQLTKDKENLAYSLANAVGQKMTVKSEAYKECIEKVKEYVFRADSHKDGFEHDAVDIDDVYNILKKLVGE